MDKVPLIEMAEMNNHILVSDNFQDVLTITDIDANSSAEMDRCDGYSDPIRLNLLLQVLVFRGEAKVSLDYVHYTITPNTFFTVMPARIFQVAGVSKDFKAKLLAMDKAFLEGINTEKRSPSMSNYMQMRANPCIVFRPEEAEHVKISLELLQAKIKLRTHSFHKEVMQNAFVGFLLELANLLAGKTENLTRGTLTRKEEIMNQFLGLLHKHVREHHVVTFYAGKLFITPQYLSLILKELTGKSANKWIDEALIIEAKVLLKTPLATVQQVADILNFSDQSTFGKFFRKHIGMSPREYRKS
ncbi:MAG: AraC family transcriptional regulator [Tannerellaceae bacterium]|jgi:AraC-like DNA-binding protein|nr:AraC family transcriptional regulator [Tannerellaceae bacterium]